LILFLFANKTKIHY